MYREIIFHYLQEEKSLGKWLMPNIFLRFMCQQGLAEPLKKQSMHFVQIENHNSSDLDCFSKLETFVQKI